MTTKNESPTITMSASSCQRSLRLQSRPPSPRRSPASNQTTDLLADRQRMIAERPRVWTAIYRDDRPHGIRQRVFDAIVQPSGASRRPRSSESRILRLDAARERAIYELALGGESPAFRKLALYKKHGPRRT